MSKGRYTLGDKSQKHVSATRCSDKSLRVYWRICEKIFVFAEFVRLAAIADTEIFTEILQYTVKRFVPPMPSPQRVAATSRPICTHGVICRRDLPPRVFRP